MPSHHHFDFARLPDRIKRQLARAIDEPAYRLQDQADDKRAFLLKRGLGIAALVLLLVLSMIARFGEPGHDRLWHGPGRMVLFGLFIGGIVYLGVALYRRWALRRLLGFEPGQYLFGFTLVDARAETLTVVDLTQVREITVTQVRGNGANHTRFAFAFRDAATRVWKVGSKKEAERFGQKLNALQTQSRTAFERNDVATLLRLDPFFEIRRKNWELPATPEPDEATLVARLLARPVLATLLATALLTPLLWTVRTVAADQSMYKQAMALKTESAYLSYIADGKLHVAEMRAALPRIAFEQVRQRHSVSALRALLARYPQAGLQTDVAAQIHLLYQEALTRFTAQAATSDPALLASMSQLLQVLEERGNAKVGIRFIRPTNDALAKMDERIRLNAARLGGRQVIPAAAHFAADSAAAREARIVTGLQNGFRTIFPNDVLSLQPINSADTQLPMLTIDYQIEPSGALYTLEKTERAFVGLIARFQSGLQVAPAVQPWRFEMNVEPPDHFRVDYAIAPGETAKGPADSQVYSVMAERAFDALSDKMRAAFFRQDSDAFKGMAKAVRPQHG